MARNVRPSPDELARLRAYGDQPGGIERLVQRTDLDARTVASVLAGLSTQRSTLRALLSAIETERAA